MELTEQIIDTMTDDGEMAVLAKEPTEAPASGGTWPTVLIFHDGPGIRTATHVFMAKLASEGYRVITPDLYHRKGRLFGVDPEMRAADPSLSQQMMERLLSLTDDGIQHDADCALRAAGVGSDTPIAVLGFCLGARAVYRAMMRLPGQVVCGATWHPSFLADDAPDSPHLTAAQLTQPLYIGIGDADEVQSIAMHQRFFDAVEPLDHVDVDIYEGADHGFTWPDHPTYNEAAAVGCWTKTTALLARTLT